METKDTHLERLSPELLTQILLDLPTSQSLQSLIRASPKCYQVFLASKAKIVSTMICRRIHPSALIDALAAIKASQLRSLRPDRKTVLNFIRRYNYQRRMGHSQRIHRLSLQAVVSLCQLYWSSQYFIRSLTKRSRYYLRQCGQPTCSEDQSPFNENILRIMDQEMPLSGVEQGRLQRAFYRYELYGHLLGSDLEYCGEKLWEHPCDSHFFLRLYNTWEQHEMACVDNYLRSRLDSVFDKVEHAFVGIEISLPHVEDEGLVDRFSKPRREAILAAKRTIHSRYLDYMLSMSLPFLHSTLELGDEEQQRKFSSHIHYDSQKRSFTNALEEQTIDNRNGDRDKIMNYLSHKEDGLPTTFGDTIETANEGWRKYRFQSTSFPVPTAIEKQEISREFSIPKPYIRAPVSIFKEIG